MSITCSILRELRKWWAQYMESTSEMETALQFYEAARDNLSLVRVYCYCGNLEKVHSLLLLKKRALSQRNLKEVLFCISCGEWASTQQRCWVFFSQSGTKLKLVVTWFRAISH